MFFFFQPYEMCYFGGKIRDSVLILFENDGEKNTKLQKAQNNVRFFFHENYRMCSMLQEKKNVFKEDLYTTSFVGPRTRILCHFSFRKNR